MLQMQSIANKRSKMVCPGYAQSLGNSTVGANKRSKMGALGPSPDNLRGYLLFVTRFAFTAPNVIGFTFAEIA